MTLAVAGCRRSFSLGYRGGLVLVILGLSVVFGLITDHFWSAVTFRTLANQLPPLVIASAGLTLVLIAGGIDLSVGSVLALAAAVLGVLTVDHGLPLLLAALVALAVGGLCGAISGSLVARWSIPSFLVTLGMLEIARGSTYLVTASRTSYLGDRVAALGVSVPILGLSAAFVGSLAVVGALQFVLTRTAFGRWVFAVGGNRTALHRCGVRPARIQFAVFTLAGLLAAVAGLCQVGYLQSADPNAAIGMELSAIAAVVIGGTSLLGGRGSVTGTLLGVLVIAVLQTGLAQAGASEPTKRIITGAAILLAVATDVWRRRRSAAAVS
ncbi:MAG: ABC transporter permease [Acidobacteriota bacterium]|nr:ABC transporter permease [Acidobacteriota bacterium]